MVTLSWSDFRKYSLWAHDFKAFGPMIGCELIMDQVQ